MVTLSRIHRTFPVLGRDINRCYLWPQQQSWLAATTTTAATPLLHSGSSAWRNKRTTTTAARQYSSSYGAIVMPDSRWQTTTTGGNIQSLRLKTLPNHHQVRCMVVVSQHKATAGSDDAATATAVVVESSSSSSSNPKSSNPVPTLPINNDKFSTDNLLVVTPSCWKQIERLATKKGYSMDRVYLRVFVDAGGCSGFTYQFEFHTIDDDDDEIRDQSEDLVWMAPNGGGARVVVDLPSMEFLRGATLDYVVEMIKSSFEIRENPNSESACGCGSSFALKNFSANPAVD